MSPLWKVATFVAQSVAVGLAIAFLIVILKPDLAGRAPARAPQAVTSYAPAVAASAPAVANIYTDRVLGTARSLPGVTLRGRALGSGVVIDPRGYVVTNWHVIDGADQVRVQLADGRVATPKLVGADPETELALLKIDLPNLPGIRLGRSDHLEVGEVVLAIGNSLGLSQTVTMGIVSATGRGQLGVTTFEDFIQTDAAINAGNSGGALVNTNGELVGINTAVLSTAPDQPMPEGLGFAIPVNLVRGVMQQLVAHGRVIRGYLGVVDPVDLPASQARALGIDGGAVLLTSVTGPAAAAGLEPGDVLTHINDQRTFTAQQAMNLVASSQPGQRIRIQAKHPDGTPFTTEAVLEERPRVGSN
ncbi:MAG TPA: trypsin-like peptidase domain-containing protein [Gammaproteobacteria bacterium]|nr:trypsin-like peptidase domain-containing protein [Gammaproteobacteria bacterium]